MGHKIDLEQGAPSSKTSTPLGGEGDAAKVIEGGSEYEAVAASQTDQVLGATGAVGDYLRRLIISVATAATGTCSIKDGAGSAMVITPANTPIGVYPVDLGMKATGAGWSVTTGAGCTVIGVGNFT